MSLFLLIDTSSEEGYAALFQENFFIDSTFLPKEKGNSKYLSSFLQELFIRNDRKISQLKAIGVGTGPGLFSGIRVGASFAKGLGLALNIPLIGFCSWEPYLAPENGLFFSVIDLKNGRYCAVLREKKDNKIFLEEAPVNLSIEEIGNKKIPFFGAVDGGIVKRVAPDFQYLGIRIVESLKKNPKEKISLQYSRPPI